MDLHVRKHLPGDEKHSRIGDDQGIRLHIPQLLKIFFYLVQIPVMSQNIGSHIDPYSPLVGKTDPFSHFLQRKIVGLGPETESLTAQIYGIGAVDHGSL